MCDQNDIEKLQFPCSNKIDIRISDRSDKYLKTLVGQKDEKCEMEEKNDNRKVEK
jgi:hypothetical protein